MKNMKSNLLVIVPVTRLYGKELNLRNWILKVSSPAISVLLVHDLQDSITSNVLRKIILEASNPRIQMIEGTYNSPGLARNKGIGFLESEWTWFVDADDLPQIDEGLAIIEKADPDTEVLIGDYSINFSELSSKQATMTHLHSLESVAINPGIWRMIFRSNSIGQTKFTNHKMGEDQLFLLRFGIFQRRVKFFNTPIYDYFKNVDGQLTSRRDDIVEIMGVISETFIIFEKSSGGTKKLIGIMLVRQIITFLKNSSFGETIRVLRKTPNKISILRMKNILTFIYSLILVCRYKLECNG